MMRDCSVRRQSSQQLPRSSLQLQRLWRVLLLGAAVLACIVNTAAEDVNVIAETCVVIVPGQTAERCHLPHCQSSAPRFTVRELMLTGGLLSFTGASPFGWSTSSLPS